MSTDLADKETEFIAELEAETGRDLAAWMRAITDAALTDRNQTIDWLRTQHVFFNRSSRAMWLERIHHNGGRPIYEGTAPESAASDARRAATRPTRMGAVGGAAAAPVAASPSPPADQPAPQPATVASDAAATSAEIDAVLARGKAYRPLAAYLLAEIRKSVPGCSVGTRAEMLMLNAPQLFAVIDVRAKDIRLGLALGDHPIEPPLERAKLTGAIAGITHMRVLTDARTIDAALIGLVQRAVARA